MSKSNGHDKNSQNGKEKVVKFPTLAERDRIRKKQQAEENAWRKEYKTQQKAGEEPFFNFGKIPPFAKILAAIFVAVHAFLSLGLSDTAQLQAIYDWGFVPSTFLGGDKWSFLTLITPISYNFIHGDWMHVGFNTVMTLALCTFVERMFSTPTTIRYFFICGIAGALVMLLFHPSSEAPVIGASASISGLFAAAILMMYEQGRMGALTGKFANKGPWPLIAVWAVIMIVIGLISGGSVAWEAHLGGFLTGAGLYRLMRTNKLRL